MSTFSSTVTCTEVHGTRSEGRDRDGNGTVSVTLQCAWTDRWSLADDIVGNQLAYPDAANLFGKSASIRPLASQGAASSQSIEYTDALVTITYANLDPSEGEESGEDLLSESLEPTAEFMTLDYHDFIWSDDSSPLKEGEAPGKLILGLEYQRTLYKQTSIPGSVLTLPGHVNSNSVTASTLGLTFPAGTLLYKCPTLNRTITSDGEYRWTINYKYSVRYTGWNKYWRASSGAWAEIKTKAGATYKSYPEAAM